MDSITSVAQFQQITSFFTDFEESSYTDLTFLALTIPKSQLFIRIPKSGKFECKMNNLKHEGLPNKSANK